MRQACRKVCRDRCLWKTSDKQPWAEPFRPPGVSFNFGSRGGGALGKAQTLSWGSHALPGAGRNGGRCQGPGNISGTSRDMGPACRQPPMARTVAVGRGSAIGPPPRGVLLVHQSTLKHLSHHGPLLRQSNEERSLYGSHFCRRCERIRCVRPILLYSILGFVCHTVPADANVR